MFSKIVFVVFAVNFIFAGSAYEPFMPAVLAPALKCYEAGNSAMVAVLQAMQDRPETDVDRINLSCLLCKVIYLAEALKVGTYTGAYQRSCPCWGLPSETRPLQFLHEELVASEPWGHSISAYARGGLFQGQMGFVCALKSLRA